MNSIKWEPKEDITVFELAQALKPMRGVLLSQKALESLPECARRHWTVKAPQQPEMRNPARLAVWLREKFCRTAWLFSFRSRRHLPEEGMSAHYDERLEEDQTATKEGRQ